MPAELDPTTSPEMDTPMPDMGQEPKTLGANDNGTDREGAMAKADLYKLANYSHKLFKQIHDEDQMEAWVQAKITKAADYIASVYHYLEYEMKFSEYGHHLDNSDTLSEGQKMRIKEMLAEAKDKMKDLKKSQAEKMKEKKMDEGILSGGERPCTECGGTGMVYEEPKPIPAHVKGKVAKYNTMVKATKAAHKRMDANHDGIPDEEEEMDESFDEKSKVGDTKKTRTGVMTKTDTGVKHTNTSYHDDGEAEEKSGKGVKSHAKAQSAAEKKDRAPAQKQSPKSAKTWGMKDGSKFDNRDKVDEAKSKKAGKDYDGDGKIESDKDEVWGSRAKAAAKAGKPFNEDIQSQLDMLMKAYNDAKAKGDQKAAAQWAADYQKLKAMQGSTPVKEAAPRGQRSQDSAIKVAQIGKSKSPGANLKQGAEDALEKGNHKKIDQIHQYATTTTPTGRAKKVSEAKPSAGLSKEKKSATVKKAKAGGDIGKPGKGFDKLAKKAGGGEKGEKIAAAAMWKNMKETVAYMAEKKAAVKDLPGNQEKIDADHDGKIEKSDLAALRAGKKETVKESSEFSRLQELTGRLNRSETPTLVENSEVNQIRALTKRLLG